MFTNFKAALMLSSAIGILSLTACQSIPSLPAEEAKQPQLDNQFALQGKIGVRTPQQSGSAFFTWRQNHEQFDIELSGILGVGKTQITKLNDTVTLNSAKTGLITAKSPEELLKIATGWDAPITHIISWVQARPATLEAKITKDEQERIVTIEEDHWNIQLNYNETNTLPDKLVLQQQLEKGQENRITIVIQNR